MSRDRVPFLRLTVLIAPAEMGEIVIDRLSSEDDAALQHGQQRLIIYDPHGGCRGE